MDLSDYHTTSSSIIILLVVLLQYISSIDTLKKKKILIAFQFWLDYEKPMCRQMGLSMINPVMSFSVKFYTPDPAQLEEEYTRCVVIFDDKILSFCVN